MFKILGVCSAIALSACSTVTADDIAKTLEAADKYDKQCAKDTVLAVMVSPILPPTFSLTVTKKCPEVPVI